MLDVDHDNGDQMSALERLTVKQKDYKRASYLWQFAHFVLGIASVSISALLASGVPMDSTDKQLLAAIVAVTASLSTFLRPDSQARKFNAARSILRRARNHYEYSNDPLVKALNEADELVSYELK